LNHTDIEKLIQALDVLVSMHLHKLGQTRIIPILEERKFGLILRRVSQRFPIECVHFVHIVTKKAQVVRSSLSRSPLPDENGGLYCASGNADGPRPPERRDLKSFLNYANVTSHSNVLRQYVSAFRADNEMSSESIMAIRSAFAKFSPALRQHATP
jgi:hypothetical protein